KNAQTKAQSCTVRASRELRSAALKVLSGHRNGRTYRIPYTQANYRASAPGEAPAARTGTLKNSWGIIAMGSAALGRYSSGIQTNVPYAELLENGTSRMAARPFREKIIQRASPRIGDIFRSAGFK
ncbi:MAG: HK97 gp10 family phage protein, partial [Oscillibacter sp.]|nr:HK97 gp10 family phage protein [Oscillibacter sp.]